MAKAQITDPIERRQILCLGNGTFFRLAKFSRGLVFGLPKKTMDRWDLPIFFRKHIRVWFSHCVIEKSLKHLQKLHEVF